MIIRFVLVFGCLSLVNFAALALPTQQKLEQIKKELGKKSFYKLTSFNSEDGKSISAAIFGQNVSGAVNVVISPGMTEPAIKYAELAHDLLQAGYGPVFVIDHRGQGFSDRVTGNPQKTHIDDFQLYVNDFRDFMNNVVRPNKSPKKTVVIGHSMGATIVSLYTLTQRNDFAAFVFSAPMFQIQLPFGKKIIRIVNKIVCMIGLCEMYLPGRGDYDPDKTVAESKVTSSADRFAFDKYLKSTYPEVVKGSATFGWLREAMVATDFIAENWKSIRWPLLLLEAEEDAFVDSSPLESMCRNLPQCRYELINGAKHEIFMESDSQRNQALQAVLKFFRERRALYDTDLEIRPKENIDNAPVPLPTALQDNDDASDLMPPPEPILDADGVPVDTPTAPAATDSDESDAVDGSEVETETEKATESDSGGFSVF